MLRLCRFHFFTLIILWLTPEACAQSMNPHVLSVDSLQSVTSRALPFRWAYRPGGDGGPGDGLGAGIDWMPVDTRILVGERLPNWQGVGWFRLVIQADSTLLGLPLGIRFFSRGAMDVYLDNALFYRIGTVGSTREETIPALQSFPQFFTLNDTLPHVLAVRYANFEPEMYHEISYPAGFWGFWGQAYTYASEWPDSMRQNGSYQWFFVGIFTVFALLHVLLFSFHRQARENLFFGLLSAGLSMFAYQYHQVVFAETPGYYVYFNYAMNTVGVFLCLAILRFLYGMFYDRPPRIFYAACLIAVVSLLMNWVRFDVAMFLVFLLAFYACLEMFRVVGISLLKKKQGSGIVGFGILSFSTGLALLVFREWGWIEPFPYINEMPFFGALVLVFSMSIYLSRNVAMTNEKLRHQLERVQVLSEQKLEQERRAHELEVERKVLEAEYIRKLQELEEARKLQLSLLPKSVPDLPDLDIAAYMETANEVGGDYYDFDVGPDGTLTIAGFGLQGRECRIAGSSTERNAARELPRVSV